MYICDNMKYLLSSLLLFLFSFVSYAQYEVEELAMPETLNTLGVNITPAAVLLFNGLPIAPRFSVVYKRQTDVSKKLRATFNYQINERFFDVRNDLPLNYSDSTITFLLESEDDFSYDLRLGVEFFKPNRTTTMVYGFDVLVGMNQTYSEKTTQPFYTDPSCDCTVPSPFVASMKSTTEIDYMYFGADFSIGQKLKAREKINVMLQWTPTLTYKIAVSENYSDISARENAPSNELHFNLQGIELFVNYVF